MLNLPSGSDMSSECDVNINLPADECVARKVNIKPVAASSPSGCKISMLELGKPGEGMRDVWESNIQFTHVSSNILFENH